MIRDSSPNTGFAAHFVRPNASHFAKPDHVRRHGPNRKENYGGEKGCTEEVSSNLIPQS